MFFNLRKEIKIVDKSLLLNDESPYDYIEAFNKLRSNLNSTLYQVEGCRKILITSWLPNESKTITTNNLAISLGKMGKKVVVVDLDLRANSFYYLHTSTIKMGFTDYISKKLPVDEIIAKSEYENLDIIFSGTRSPNPGELIASSRTADLIAYLEKIYDYIIFDSAPIGLVPDILSLCPLVDLGIVMAKHKVTKITNIKESLKTLEFAMTKKTTVIISQIDNKKAGGKYGKYGKYGRYGRYGRYSNNYFVAPLNTEEKKQS